MRENIVSKSFLPQWLVGLGRAFERSARMANYSQNTFIYLVRDCRLGFVPGSRWAWQRAGNFPRHLDWSKLRHALFLDQRYVECRSQTLKLVYFRSPSFNFGPYL